MPVNADIGANSAHKIHAPIPQSDRVRALQRAFQRELGRKPTELQRSLIAGAAVMQCAFETAAATNASANDLVRLSGEARRARQDMLASFHIAGQRHDDSTAEVERLLGAGA